TTPAPEPDVFTLKMPGAVLASGTSTAFESAPLLLTTIVALLPVAANGTTALTCVLLTAISGAAVPFTVTCTPPSDAGSGNDEACSDADDSPDPKMLNSSPGASGLPNGAKLAAFTIPMGLINTPVPLNAGAFVAKSISNVLVSKSLWAESRK